MNNQYFYLGKFIKKNDYTRSFIAVLDTDSPEQYRELDVVFVEIDKTFIPFFIENIEIAQNRAEIQFDEYPEEQISNIICRSDIYLPIERLPELKNNQYYYHEIVDYEVRDELYHFMGYVKDIIEQKHQSLLIIADADKEILVPVTDEIIYKIDKKKKILYTRIPEGLPDINS